MQQTVGVVPPGVITLLAHCGAGARYWVGGVPGVGTGYLSSVVGATCVSVAAAETGKVPASVVSSMTSLGVSRSGVDMLSVPLHCLCYVNCSLRHLDEGTTKHTMS